MRKKKLIILSIIILPLLILVGFSTWIILNETIFAPSYVAGSTSIIAQAFDGQSSTYNKSSQGPTSSLPEEISDEEVNFSYRVYGSNSAYTDGLPTNAETYEIYVESDIYTNEVVLYTINKADPTLDTSKLSLIPTVNFEGDSLSTSGSISASGVSDDTSLTGSVSFKDSKRGTTELIYPDNADSATETVNITMIYTPTGSYSHNYNSLEFTLQTTIYAVAHIDSTVYYGTIKKAVDDAGDGDTVYVIPSLPITPEIDSDIVIVSGATLCLPYDGTTYDGRQIGLLANMDYPDEGNAFADSSEALITKHLKNEVILKQGKKITINSGGFLRIGAIVGNEADYKEEGGMNLCGQTSGDYSQITMEASSSIVSNGTIECLGYIKESSQNNSSIVEASSGEVYLPFVIYDYQGGWHTAGAYCGSGLLTNMLSAKGYIAPFCIFDCPNIQSKLKITSSSQLIGYADIYTRATASLSENQHNNTTVKLIGPSSSIINLTAGAYTLIKYTDNGSGLTLDDSVNGKTSLDIYGGATSGTMSLSLTVGISMTIDTENILLPVSWKYSIGLYAGVYNIKNKFKFMGGSSLFINNDATVNVTNEVIVYPETSNYTYVYPSNQKSKESNFINNGICNINSGFGGKISTSSQTAKLNVNTIVDFVKSVEGIGEKDGDLSVKFTEQAALFETISGPFVTTSGIKETNLYIENFQSNGQAWYASTVTITLNSNGGILSGSSTIGPNETGSGYIINSVNVTNPSRDFYQFIGWYSSSNCLDSELVYFNDGDGNVTSNPITIYSDITLYAGWTPIDYTITYDIQDGESGITHGQITNPNPTFYNYESSINLVAADDGNLVFDGWYSDSTYSTQISTITKTSGNITLYGRWYKEGTETYVVSYVIQNNTENSNVSTSLTSTKVLSSNTTWKPTDLSAGVNDVSTVNYYFDGWYTDSNYTNEYTSLTGSVTLYGRYYYKVKVNTYYNEENEKFENSNLVLLESAYKCPSDNYIIPENFEHNKFYGYSFDGFSCDKDASKKYQVGDAYTIPSSTVNKEENIIVVNFTTSYSTRESATITITNNVKSPGTGTFYIYDDGVEIYKEFITVAQAQSSGFLGLGTTPVNTYFKTYIGYSFSLIVDTDGASLSYSNTTQDEYGYYIVSGSITINVSACIPSGTLLTLADGTQKKVEDVLDTDMLLVFNHETGKFEAAPIIFVDIDEWKNYNIVNLEFSNGTKTRLIYEHGYFDLTLNKYVYITESNYQDYIGHEFAFYDGDKVNSVTLTNSYITNEYVGCYSPVTAYHLNYIVDGYISMPGGIEGLFNIFEYNDDMTYDIEKMNEDIEKYGLYTYEDFKDYLPYEVYLAFPGPYLKVSVEKGYITFEEIIGYIEQYLGRHGLDK